MNTFALYQFVGDWAGELIYFFVLLLVVISGYLITVFYRWWKNKEKIWSSELPWFIFPVIMAFGIALGTHLKEKYEQNLAALQQKELVQQFDAKTAIDRDLMIAAGKMLKLTGIEISLAEHITVNVSAAIDNIRRIYPDMDKEKYQHCKKMIQQKMEEKIPAILQKIISFYAEQYSMEEIMALNTFYSSPVGQKIKEVKEALHPHIINIICMWSYRASQIAGNYLLGVTRNLKVTGKDTFLNDQLKTGIKTNDTEKNTVFDPEHLAAARKYLELSGYEDRLAATSHVTVNLANDILKKTQPDLKKVIYKYYGQIFAAEMKKDMPVIMDEVTLLYAGQYSLAECRELHAFFLSPVGKKAKQVKKKLSDIMVEKFQKWTLQSMEQAVFYITATD